MPPPGIRLRTPTPGLLSLPWDQPLGTWDATEVPLRDIPVGPSRHLVRFVETEGRLFALKELPRRVARKEYGILRDLEVRALPAVRPAGLVDQGDDSVLVTRYLTRSWQYRRLLMRLPPGTSKHRERLLDAMAGLMVDLHRNGVFWGDCSLANTLFMRDGQSLQAYLVDAETSEIHPSLTDGQRQLDLGILVENVAGGLYDLAVRLELPEEELDEQLAAAESVAARYTALWDELFRDETVDFRERWKVEARIRRLNDLGFAVDEIRLDPNGDGHEHLHVQLTVAGRSFHAEELRRRTGLEVGEGQARILLNDLNAFEASLQGASSPAGAADRWVHEVLRPALARIESTLGPVTDPIQAYCDLLEVRWLLSEEAQRDVGDDVALAALAARREPPESAARMSVAEASTETFPAIRVD